MEKKFVHLTDEQYNNYSNDYEKKMENYNKTGTKLKNNQKSLRVEYLNLILEKNRLEEEILRVKHSIEALEIKLENNSFNLKDVESDFNILMDSAESLSIKAKSSDMLNASINILSKEIQDKVVLLKSEKMRLNDERRNILSDKDSLQKELAKLNTQYNDILSNIKKNKKNQTIIEKNIKINNCNIKNVDTASITCKEAYYNSEPGDQISAKIITPNEKVLKKLKK